MDALSAIEFPRARFNASLIAVCFLIVILMIPLVPALWPNHQGTGYIIGSSLLGGVMMLAWWFTRQVTSDDRRQIIRTIFIVGIVARVVLIAANPMTSNDSERYLWDGAVFLAGFDPYVTTPNDAVVADMRAIWPTPPEHAKYPTVYPPLALMSFSVAALAGPVWGFWLWKLMIGLASVGTLFIARKLLVGFDKEQHIALVALSPILILEAGIGAHLDAFLVLGGVAALYVFTKGQNFMAGALIGLAAAIKFLPVLFIGPMVIYLFFEQRERKNRAAIGHLLAGTIVAFGGVYLAAYLYGLTPIGSLPVFFEKWRGGSPVFALLDSYLTSTNLQAAQGGLLVLILSLAAYVSRQSLIRGLQIALTAPLLVLPVVFPWYLSLLVPLIALRPSGFLILWTFTLPLIYEVLDAFKQDGVTWNQADWPLTVIAVGWAIGIFSDLKKQTISNN